MSSAGQTNEGAMPRVINGSGGLPQNGALAPSGPAPSGSVIGADILVTGNIEAEVDLHIEGRVLGDVRCATLILGEQSSVQGSIFAQRVRVSGSVEGSVETRDLAIEATARVKGDVTYSRLRIANGGIVEGSLTHRAVADDASEDARLKLVSEEGPKPQPTPAAPTRSHYFE